MLSANSVQAKFVIVVIIVASLAWLLVQGQSVQSFTFFSPPPGTSSSCDASQIVCPSGATKTFGPFTIGFPNGFYMSRIRVYCDPVDISSVPAPPADLNPAAQPVACYFGHMGGEQHEQPVYKFLQYIYITSISQPVQSSTVGLYIYRTGKWTALPNVDGAFYLDELNPINNTNYFWLLETSKPIISSATTTAPEKPTSLPPTSTPTTLPTQTSMPTNTPNPTETSTPTNSPTPSPTSTAPPPSSVPTHSFPTLMPTIAQPASSKKTSPLLIGGLGLGLVIAIVLLVIGVVELSSSNKSSN